MITIRQLKKLHRYSGIALSVFFFFHVINHLCALGGAAFHIQVMNIFRKIYRFPPVEAVILLAAVVQVTVGLALVWKKGLQRNVMDVLQIGSGLYLSFFLFYHIRAVMMGRYVWNVETDFHFAAAGLKSSSDFYFFLPYYSLSIIAVFVHIACVHYQKVQSGGATVLLAKRQAMCIMGAGAVCTGVVMYSFIVH